VNFAGFVVYSKKFASPVPNEAPVVDVPFMKKEIGRDVGRADEIALRRLPGAVVSARSRT
jgi:hypothetical protein